MAVVVNPGLDRSGRGQDAARPAAEGPGAAAAPDLTESEPQAQPAAQKPTGATPALEKPRTAEPATAEPRSARPDRKKPWSTERSSVGSGAVLEPPALTEAGAEVQGNRMETPDTTPVQGDRGDVDMVDEPIFKEEQVNVVYSAEDIKEFLRNTKWQKNVALEEFFPDRKQFIHDVKFFRREGAFVDVEIFRLKKLITRYTLNVTRDIVRLLKALEMETVELQCLEATGDRGHIEALKTARELDRELSLEELHEALQTMQNGRASGIDGLPAEFYKAFWAVIGQDVLDVLWDSIRRGELPLSCRRAVLTLLPKKGDLTHLKNWHPVSLL
ncbi:hypothetical protein QTP70_008646 [Hemibagrus guttatus]|uniref:Reverse transcriptase n=1 Tax=Hemibagrus guttatus TaxID=175788 RepID=A0AAE0USP8_9TELE|nr:hypothetical protein QTP70_008646 [Hemibagrus guttatus]